MKICIRFGEFYVIFFWVLQTCCVSGWYSNIWTIFPVFFGRGSLRVTTGSSAMYVFPPLKVLPLHAADAHAGFCICMLNCVIFRCGDVIIDVKFSQCILLKRCVIASIFFERKYDHVSVAFSSGVNRTDATSINIPWIAVLPCTHSWLRSVRDLRCYNVWTNTFKVS